MKFNISNKIFSLIAAASAVLGLSSCEEFGPVFTGKYDEPAPYEYYTDEDFAGKTHVTIAELKAMYPGTPLEISDDIYIKGQVVSSDRSGNVYKTMYIQDETAGIEIKMGKTGLYNEYKTGQWVYILCKDLSLGNYRGMIGLGYESSDPKYETAYIEVQLIIDSHVFRGEMGDPVQPEVLTETTIADLSNLATYVTVPGLVYMNRVFCMLYYDPDGNREDYQNNCLFLDEEGDGNYGINTWALTEERTKAHYYEDRFDGMATKDFVSFTPYSVSQYFEMGSETVQIRSSGYSRFADEEIDPEIRSGAPISATGILTIYDGEHQLTLLDLSGIRIE